MREREPAEHLFTVMGFHNHRGKSQQQILLEKKSKKKHLIVAIYQQAMVFEKKYGPDYKPKTVITDEDNYVVPSTIVSVHKKN